jgi:hypothetical protein
MYAGIGSQSRTTILIPDPNYFGLTARTATTELRAGSPRMISVLTTAWNGLPSPGGRRLDQVTRDRYSLQIIFPENSLALFEYISNLALTWFDCCFKIAKAVSAVRSYTTDENRKWRARAQIHSGFAERLQQR